MNLASNNSCEKEKIYRLRGKNNEQGYIKEKGN